MNDQPRHIISLSGGKDSAALAIYIKDREQWRSRLGIENLPECAPVPVEYVFMDTGKELPETYKYLDKLEAYLGIELNRVHANQDFDFYLKGDYFSMLPSPQARWCTRLMKLRPFEAFCGDSTVYSYIGIRADEDREGYISHKANIRPQYPFREDGIIRRDVFRILEDSGLGLPGYYDKLPIVGNGTTVEVGRSRSGCTFCFFQQKIEWVWLLEKHPDAYEEAAAIERAKPNGYTWSAGESLDQLKERRDQIVIEYAEQLRRRDERVRANSRLVDLYGDDEDDSDRDEGCNVCHL
jgi:hypothetical protein